MHNLKCLQEDVTILTDLKKIDQKNLSFWYKILTVQMLNTVFPPKSAWSQINAASLTLRQIQEPHLEALIRNMIQIN